MNHKEFFKELEKKNLFDLENLIELTEEEYEIYYPHRDKSRNKHLYKAGEIDKGYINLEKRYAYVIEYKSLYKNRTYSKACKQCHKDVTFVNQQYHIPKDRIFCFVAFGKKKSKLYDIIKI